MSESRKYDHIALFQRPFLKISADQTDTAGTINARGAVWEKQAVNLG
jgi:hypothetical protein